MFAEHCPRHDARVLLPPSRIEAIHNTPDGVVVTWRCWCGHVGRTDRRRAPATPAVPSATPATPATPAMPAGPTADPAPLSRAS